MSLREKLPLLHRTLRAVTLPGGDVVHVCDLSIAEMDAIDRAAVAACPEEGTERSIRAALLECAAALCEPDGSRPFVNCSTEDLEIVAGLTPDQIRAVRTAVMPTVADAKKD